MRSGETRRRSARWVLLAMLASVVLPLWLGQVAYERGWFAGGQTNKGELLTPPLALNSWLGASSQGHVQALSPRWWITYVVPSDCDEACRNSWEALPRMQAGLGRYRDRVGVLLISGADSVAVPDALRRDPDVRVVHSELAVADPAARGRWHIMDPMGWIMLRYVPPAEPHAAVLAAQDLLDDLQKLLKVSRIG